MAAFLLLPSPHSFIDPMHFARYFLSVWLISLILPVSGLQAEQPPNILFIYLDDYGWRDATCLGSDFYETPHIDRLASQGMLFTDAYAAAANCAPSRACLLSGQYTPRHEIYNVGTKARGKPAFRQLVPIPGTDTLRDDITTWADALHDAGYVTASMGKWHLSDNPCQFGFDLNIGGSHSGSPPQGYFPPHRVQGLETAANDQEYLTDRLHDEAIKFIETNRDKRWCLYLTHFAVHTPLQAKQELIAKYKAKPKGKLHQHAVMAAMIESVDQGIGRLLEKLDQLQLSDNTVVLLSSDNGGYGPATSMRPLKGYKGVFYEGGIRVPLIVRWPGVVKPASLSHEPVTGVDLFPTLVEMGQAQLPEQPLDGVSLLPLLRGGESLDREAIYWHFPAYLESYAVSDQQRDPLFRTRPCSIVRAGDWKLHEYFEDGALELYNLRDDISEQHNLADSQPEQRDRLHQMLIHWRTDIHAPVPREKNPQFDLKAMRKAIEQKTGNQAEN
jgi:arylsulfatase A-like enzyme